MSARGQGSIVRSVEINDPKIGAPPVGEHVAELAHINNSAAIRRDLRVDSILEVENVRGRQAIGFLRSEEHTSELQSRLHLVCRLLLEKKKKKIYTDHIPNKHANKTH